MFKITYESIKRYYLNTMKDSPPWEELTEEEKINFTIQALHEYYAGVYL